MVVAHTAYFGRLLAEHSLKELLRYFEEHGRWVDARSVLARHDDPDVLALAGVVERNGVSLPQGSEPVPYNETVLFSAFQQDLAAARQQVVIFSPYIHVNRLSHIAPHLRAAVERGVQVAVVTLPEREQPEDGASLHQELMRVGVRVIPRTGMHEKRAIIDELVTWFGGLNILSHSRSRTDGRRQTAWSASEELGYVSGDGRCRGGIVAVVTKKPSSLSETVR